MPHPYRRIGLVMSTVAPLVLSACEDDGDPTGGTGGATTGSMTAAQGSSSPAGSTSPASGSSVGSSGNGGGPGDCGTLDPGCTVWTKHGGDRDDQYGASVATDGQGNIVVAGHFGGTLDWGGRPLTSAGDLDVHVAKLDTGGEHVWSRGFGDAAEQYLSSVAVDGDGNVIVTGYFHGTIDFGGGDLYGVGKALFIAKLDPMGNHVWSKSFGGAIGHGVATDAGNNVIVAGEFHGTVDFGGGGLTTLGDPDVFVLKLDPAGNHLWSKGFGDDADQAAFATATDADGNVVVTGFMEGAADFGGGALTSAGDRDVFVAKLDASGNHVWSERYGDATFQQAYTVAIDASASTLVMGSVGDTIDFGGGPLAGAGIPVFVAKLDADGNHVWSQSFDSGGQCFGTSLATDASGNVFLTGYFDGVLGLGGGSFDSLGIFDAYLAKLDASGNHVWTRHFGDPSVQHGSAITIDPAGEVVLTGNVQGTVDFGTGPLVSAGGYDVFVAKVVP